MSLDMFGLVDAVFDSQPAGGVTIHRAGTAGYYDYDNGGVWVPGASPAPVEAPFITIQAANKKTIEFSVSRGGTADPKDLRNVYLNDGSQLLPADTGRESDYLEFSDGLNVRMWRVLTADNRPWRNYCHAIVERTTEAVT